MPPRRNRGYSSESNEISSTGTSPLSLNDSGSASARSTRAIASGGVALIPSSSSLISTAFTTNINNNKAHLATKSSSPTSKKRKAPIELSSSDAGEEKRQRSFESVHVGGPSHNSDTKGKGKNGFEIPAPIQIFDVEVLVREEEKKLIGGVPAMNKERLEELLEDFECGICYETIVRAMSTQCGHSFCGKCSIDIRNSNSTTECPVCREKNYLPFIPNFHLDKAIEKIAFGLQKIGECDKQFQKRKFDHQRKVDEYNRLKARPPPPPAATSSTANARRAQGLAELYEAQFMNNLGSGFQNFPAFLFPNLISAPAPPSAAARNPVWGRMFRRGAHAEISDDEGEYQEHEEDDDEEEAMLEAHYPRLARMAPQHTRRGTATSSRNTHQQQQPPAPVAGGAVTRPVARTAPQSYARNANPGPAARSTNRWVHLPPQNHGVIDLTDD